MAGDVVKVMYLIDAYDNPFAGTEGQLRMLIDGLDRTRFQPSLTLLRRSKYIDERGFSCPAEVLNVGSMASLRSISAIWKFAKTLRRNNYRLVHIFFNDASIIAPFFLKLAGLKVIISRRDMGYWYSRGALSVLRINSLYVDHAVVNSRAVKQITSKKEWLSPEKISVIYNGYEMHTDGHALGDELATTVLQKYLAENDLIVGVVANIRPIKRLEDIVRAMPNILAHVPRARLVLIGGGDSTALTRLAETLGVSHAVFFLGSQAGPKAFIRRFNVAVLCSESEGFSNAIVEYMMCGKPVVCTNVGGNGEIVVEGETGYLVEVGDTSALADRIVRVLSNSRLEATLGARGLELASREFSKGKMLEAHCSLYASLL